MLSCALHRRCKPDYMGECASGRMLTLTSHMAGVNKTIKLSTELLETGITLSAGRPVLSLDWNAPGQASAHSAQMDG